VSQLSVPIRTHVAKSHQRCLHESSLQRAAAALLAHDQFSSSS
jgi:hypothetical protein